MSLGVTESTTWVDLSKVEGVSSTPLVNAGNTLMRGPCQSAKPEIGTCSGAGHRGTSYTCEL